MSSIFDQVKLHAALTDRVIVSYSGGKDSAATLELCARYFKKVNAFFMYDVPGLSFQEAVLRWAEKRYGIEIYRMPHWQVSHDYRSGAFVLFDPDVPVVSIRDVYEHVRGVFDTYWIAAGERAKDSVVRGAMIKKSGSVDRTRGRFYPLAYWDKEQVLRFCNMHNLKFSPEAGVLGGSMNNWHPERLAKIKQHYPADYAKIKKAYPMIEALVVKHELYGEKSDEPRADAA